MGIIWSAKWEAIIAPFLRKVALVWTRWPTTPFFRRREKDLRRGGLNALILEISTDFERESVAGQSGFDSRQELKASATLTVTFVSEK
jgi:hypothetical protein